MGSAKLLRVLDELSFVSPVILMATGPDPGLPPARDGVTLLRKPISATDLLDAIGRALKNVPLH